MRFQYREGKAFWHPNNLWVKFEPTFRQGLVHLYKGFYLNDKDLFDKSLQEISMDQGLDPEGKEKLKDVIFSHFGTGDQEEVQFSLSEFQQSFLNLFDFFVKHEIQVKDDFFFLGVYLISLYMTQASF
mgnify:CR=1 FL=1